VLLWENTDTTVKFTKQEISLPQSLNNFHYIGILWRGCNNKEIYTYTHYRMDNYYVTHDATSLGNYDEYSFYWSSPYFMASDHMYNRMFWCKKDLTTLYFHSAIRRTDNSTVSDIKCIPVAIYGYYQ